MSQEWQAFPAHIGWWLLSAMDSPPAAVYVVRPGVDLVTVSVAGVSETEVKNKGGMTWCYLGQLDQLAGSRRARPAVMYTEERELTEMKDKLTTESVLDDYGKITAGLLRSNDRLIKAANRLHAAIASLADRNRELEEELANLAKENS